MATVANSIFQKLGGRNNTVKFPKVGQNAIMFTVPSGKTVTYAKVTDGYKVMIGSSRRKLLLQMTITELHPIMFHWFNAVATTL